MTSRESTGWSAADRQEEADFDLVNDIPASTSLLVYGADWLPTLSETGLPIGPFRWLRVRAAPWTVGCGVGYRILVSMHRLPSVIFAPRGGRRVRRTLETSRSPTGLHRLPTSALTASRPRSPIDRPGCSGRAASGSPDGGGAGRRAACSRQEAKRRRPGEEASSASRSRANPWELELMGRGSSSVGAAHQRLKRCCVRAREVVAIVVVVKESAPTRRLRREPSRPQQSRRRRRCSRPFRAERSSVLGRPRDRPSLGML